MASGAAAGACLVVIVPPWERPLIVADILAVGGKAELVIARTECHAAGTASETVSTVPLPDWMSLG